MSQDKRRNDRTRPPRQPPAPMERLDPGRAGLPALPVTDVAMVADALEHAQQAGLNVLAPLTKLQIIPPNYQVSIRVVIFPLGGWRSGTYSNGVWYKTDGGGLALHKPALRQLAAAAAAGMSWDTERTDDQTNPNRWEYKAIGRVRNMDGQWRTVTASKEVDLRDESPMVQDMIASAKKRRRDPWVQIQKARTAGGRMAEAKAINALIRSALGIQGSYTREQAARPFVFPLLIYIPPNTREVRLLQAAVELGAGADLFGPGALDRTEPTHEQPGVYAPPGQVLDHEDSGDPRPGRHPDDPGAAPPHWMRETE